MVPLVKSAANVIDLIAETPLVKQALAERNAAVALQRKTQIGELRRLEREMARVYPGLEAAIAAAVSEVKQADAAAVAARRRFDRAVGAKAEAACRFTANHDRIESELRQTSSPAIKEFISEMLTALDAARKAAAWSSTHEVNEVTGAGRTTTVNNLAAVQARVDAIRAAMAAAEELAVGEPDQSIVPDKLQQLRAGLPPVDPAAWMRQICPMRVRALGEHEVDIRMSTSGLGRDGHVLEPRGAELANYRANPIILWQHDSGSPVGRAGAIRVDSDAISARVTFAPARISAKADEIRGLVKSGIVNAVSVGFEGLEGEPIDPKRPRGGQHFTRWELLECSFVSVPADPGATVTARSAARACPWPEQGSAMPAAARRFDPVYFSAAGRFSSLAEQLRAIARYERDGGEPDHRLVRAATGAAETDPTAGGFLVQQDFAETLIGSIYEQSEIAQRCDRRQTDFPGRDCLVPAVDETSRADGSRWGGVASYWVAEAASISSSFPKFRRVAFNPQKIIAVVYGTGELHEDVPMFDAHLRRALASELVFQLDKAVLLGSAGTPLGVTNAGCTIQVAKETGQASGTILLENVDKMWTRLPAPCRRRATWFCCEDAEAQLG